MKRANLCSHSTKEAREPHTPQAVTQATTTMHGASRAVSPQTHSTSECAVEEPPGCGRGVRCVSQHDPLPPTLSAERPQDGSRLLLAHPRQGLNHPMEFPRDHLSARDRFGADAAFFTVGSSFLPVGPI